MAEQGTRATGALIANIAIRRPGGLHVDLVISSRLGPDIAATWATLSADDATPITDAIRTAAVVLLHSDAERELLYPHLLAASADAGLVATASIPMRSADGAVLGAVGFGWNGPRQFSADDLVLLETVAELCGQSMDRARLYDLEHDARNVAENLQQFTMALANTDTSVDVADVVVLESMRMLGAVAASLSAIGPDGLFHIVAADGFDDDSMNRWRTFSATRSSPVGDALRTRRMITLNTDETVLATYPALAARSERYGEQSWVALPLIVGADAPAVLFAAFAERRPFLPDDLSVMATMAGQAAQSFERARLREDDLREAERARQLAKAISGLAAADTRAAVAATFVDALPALGAQAGALALVSDDGGSLELAGASGYSTDLVEKWRTRPIDATSPMVDAARTGTAEFVNGPDELAERYDPETVSMLGPTVSSWVALPLRVSGRTLGSLGISFSDPQSFDDEQRVGLASFAALCANALTRAARYELEHSIAVTLQSSLLPGRLQPLAGVVLSAQYAPGTRELTVGGDWYDVIACSHDRFLLVVGDVVGHGIESAAAMGKLATATRALAQVEQRPAALLTQLDRVAMADPTTQFTSMAIVLVDPRAGELHYSLAGHPSPLVRRKDRQLVRLDGARSIPLGGLTVERPQHTVRFDGSIVVLLYTDGLTERRGVHIDERIELLESTLGGTESNVSSLPRVILAAMMTGGEQHDDVALLCAGVSRIVPVYERTIAARTAELATVRRDLRSWLQTSGAAVEGRDDILVAVGEALTNAMEHGHGYDGGPIDLRAEHLDNRYSISIQDHGRWRPPVDSDGARGRGLQLMGQLMDEMEIVRNDWGTLVRLTKFVEQENGSEG